MAKHEVRFTASKAIQSFIMYGHTSHSTMRYYVYLGIPESWWDGSQSYDISGLRTVFIKTFKVNFIPEQAKKAQKGSRGIALLFLSRRLYMGVGGQRHTSAALSPGKRPGTHCVGDWVVSGAGLRKNLANTGIRSANRPTRSESLYLLRYPGPHWGFRPTAKV